MANTTNNSTEVQKQIKENFNRLLLQAMGYIALAGGPFTPSALHFASEIMSRISGQTYSMAQINTEWRQLAGRIDTFLTGIATTVSHLPDQHKEFIIYHCGLIAVHDGRFSEIENRALQRLAATLAISHEGYTRSLNAVLKTPSSAFTKTKATPGPFPSQVITNPSDSKTKLLRSQSYFVKRLVFTLLVVLTVGVYTIDYIYDYDQYISGYKAYTASNCITALSYFDRLSDSKLLGWHVGLTNQFEIMAQKAASQCETFAKAEQMQMIGKYGDALLQLTSVLSEEVPQFIHDTAQQRMQTLSRTIRPEALAILETCQQPSKLNLEQFFSNDHSLLLFHLTCSDIYTKEKMESRAFDLHTQILIDFPEFADTTKVEQILLDSWLACEQSTSLIEKENIRNRVDFMGDLYLSCGQRYEKQGDYKNAVRVYEEFKHNYKTHPKLSAINAALAQGLFNYALSLGAPEIPTPSRSGTTILGKTVVVIRNDSPERIRISFSGPESRIEEVDACQSCRDYDLFQPSACPEKGPYSTYTLKPGAYNVVVESISGRDVTPFVGTWELESGSEYSHCFFIVTKKVLR
jgi:hypothetical protein